MEKHIGSINPSSNNIIGLIGPARIISLLKIRNQSRSLLLRSAIYTAQRQHLCNFCTGYIQPNQKYEKHVRLSNNIVYETKQHVDPLCDYPREEEKYMQELCGAEEVAEDQEVA